MIRFEVLHAQADGGARCGRLLFRSASVETPAFMPVGTAATVKATPHEWLEELGADLILSNTYHLYLRPGMEVIRSFGGLHEFMGWGGAILTDSGGYQVFSHQELNRITEEGVDFKSHLDGSRHFFSPEISMQVQSALGSDIVMAFDDCTPYPVTHGEAARSMRRSMRWARRSQKALSDRSQALFGIVQGSVYKDLRVESIESLQELSLPGIAMGGFSVGEPKLLMHELLEELRPNMPDCPRYLMGVGTPIDLVRAVRSGYDMFDCVLPTRNARNGNLFTWNGVIRIKNSRYRLDRDPIDSGCGCPVCRRFSRAYLRHLYLSGEILASVLNTLHNLYFYLDLMREIRSGIRQGTLERLMRRVEEVYAAEGA